MGYFLMKEISRILQLNFGIPWQYKHSGWEYNQRPMLLGAVKTYSEHHERLAKLFTLIDYRDRTFERMAVGILSPSEPFAIDPLEHGIVLLDRDAREAGVAVVVEPE